MRPILGILVTAFASCVVATTTALPALAQETWLDCEIRLYKVGPDGGVVGSPGTIHEIFMFDQSQHILSGYSAGHGLTPVPHARITDREVVFGGPETRGATRIDRGTGTIEWTRMGNSNAGVIGTSGHCGPTTPRTSGSTLF